MIHGPIDIETRRNMIKLRLRTETLRNKYQHQSETLYSYLQLGIVFNHQPFTSIKFHEHETGEYHKNKISYWNLHTGMAPPSFALSASIVEEDARWRDAWSAS